MAGTRLWPVILGKHLSQAGMPFLRSFRADDVLMLVAIAIERPS